MVGAASVLSSNLETERESRPSGGGNQGGGGNNGGGEKSAPEKEKEAKERGLVIAAAKAQLAGSAIKGFKITDAKDNVKLSGLYKRYFMSDALGLSVFDYKGVGLVPNQEDQVAQAQTVTSKKDPGGSPSDRIGTDEIEKQMQNRRSEMQAYLNTQAMVDSVKAETRDGGNGKGKRPNTLVIKYDDKNLYTNLDTHRAASTCATFPFCNHVPAPPPLLPGPGVIHNDENLMFPWMKYAAHHRHGQESKIARASNLNSPLGASPFQLRPHWALADAFSPADSETLAQKKGGFHPFSTAPLFGRILDNHDHADRTAAKSTVQHKWKIVNELPVRDGVTAESTKNYGDWKRTKDGKREGPSIQDLGTVYKDSDPSLKGYGPHGGLAMGDRPEPPAMPSEYLPAEGIHDADWTESSRTPDKKLDDGANYIRA